MLMATAEDALDILGYASNEKIESMVLPKKEKPEKKDKTGKRTSKKEDVGKIESQEDPSITAKKIDSQVL